MMLFVRSFIFYVGYCLATLIFGLVSLVLPIFSKKIGRRVILVWIDFVLFWLRVCCGVKVNIRGHREVLTSPVVIVSNHQSNWETFFFQQYFSPLSTILKQELLSIPLFGWGLRILEPVAIDRGSPVHALKKIKRHGLERLQAGHHLLVFPEGTRRPVGELGQYKRSAADIAQNTGVPIVPVAHNSGEHWLNKKYIKIPGTIEVVIGEPLTVTDKGTKAVMQEIQCWTQEQLDKMIAKTPDSVSKE